MFWSVDTRDDSEVVLSFLFKYQAQHPTPPALEIQSRDEAGLEFWGRVPLWKVPLRSGRGEQLLSGEKVAVAEPSWETQKLGLSSVVENVLVPHRGGSHQGKD